MFNKSSTTLHIHIYRDLSLIMGGEAVGEKRGMASIEGSL
jgi:hypothetical protein